MKSLPQEFIERLSSLGHDAYLRLPEIIDAAEPVVSVRANPAKTADKEELFEMADPVEWNPDGIYLPVRPQFTLDPRLHQGLYYVQEASSMVIRRAVEKALEGITEGRCVRYLDACAAPGGKTTAAIDALPDDAFVVANEFDPRRAQILIENLAKWGVEAAVTRGDASRMPFPRDFFDIIAADVPCSGEGMMRKDSFAIEQWSTGLVRECADRQREIVRNLWDALRPGGFLIYSTCTFNLEENEEIIDYMVKELEGEVQEINPERHGALGAMGGYSFPVCRFVPGETRGEGLFMALVRKPEQPCRESAVKAHKPSGIKTPVDVGKLLSGDYTLLSNDPLRAVRTSHLPLYALLEKTVKPIAAGIEAGKIKGRDFIPSQQLALSRKYRRGAFPEQEISRDDALSYLRRETLVLPPDTPRGIVLLTFGDKPLGWVKNLGNRANNLYPDTWRIRN